MSRLWVQLDLQVTAVSTLRFANAIRLSGCKIWLSKRNDLCWTCLNRSQILPGNHQKNLLKFNCKASKSTKMSITLKTPRTHPKRWIDLLRSPAFSSRQLESLLWSAGRLDWYTFTSHEVQLLKLSAANRGHWTTPRLATWSWGPFQTQWLASKKSNVLTLISIWKDIVSPWKLKTLPNSGQSWEVCGSLSQTRNRKLIHRSTTTNFDLLVLRTQIWWILSFSSSAKKHLWKCKVFKNYFVVPWIWTILSCLEGPSSWNNSDAPTSFGFTDWHRRGAARLQRVRQRRAMAVFKFTCLKLDSWMKVL